ESMGKGKADLPHLPVKYGDYAAWQQKWLSNDLIQEQLNYWKDELSGDLPILDLPIDYARPPVQTYNGTVYSLDVSEQLKNNLNDLSKQQGTTMFMTLLAAYQSFLTKYTGQNDVIVGSPIANRNHEDIEGLIGFFVNTLSFRLEVKDQMNFNNVLAAIRNKAINAYINQDIPFEKVVDEVQPERNLSYSPIYQTVFIYQNNVLLNDKCEELTLEEWDTTQHMADFDITLRMNEKTYGFEVAFEYNTDLFKEETIRRMTKNFIQWLENIATQPKKKLTQLPLLDDEEKHQLLMDWNQSVTSSHAFPSIPEWFEKQVEASPEAPAVTCAGQTLSYKQLNEKANQLARYLIDHGVQAEDRVGICLGKSTDMIVSMMGILKAG